MVACMTFTSGMADCRPNQRCAAYRPDEKIVRPLWVRRHAGVDVEMLAVARQIALAGTDKRWSVISEIGGDRHDALGSGGAHFLISTMPQSAKAETIAVEVILNTVALVGVPGPRPER